MLLRVRFVICASIRAINETSQRWVWRVFNLKVSVKTLRRHLLVNLLRRILQLLCNLIIHDLVLLLLLLLQLLLTLISINPIATWLHFVWLNCTTHLWRSVLEALPPWVLVVARHHLLDICSYLECRSGNIFVWSLTVGPFLVALNLAEGSEAVCEIVFVLKDSVSLPCCHKVLVILEAKHHD